jgi:hypothetical protein
VLCRFIRRYAEYLKTRHRFASNRFASVDLVETKMKMLCEILHSRIVCTLIPHFWRIVRG